MLASRLTATAAFIVLPFAVLAAQQAGVTQLPDSIVARIDRAFAGLGGAQAPGCAIGLSQNGRPVLTRAYGLANLEYGVANTPETIFESGSVAKQFTAAAVILLAQDGRLSIDDDVRKYVTEVPKFGTTITIRHLLTHTSGLRDQWGLLGLKGLGPGSQVHTLETIIDLVQHQKALNFEPGAEYLYSNTGYALAAVIVKRVSGKSFSQFSNERLFAPLGMTNTQWRDDYTKVVKNRATAYAGNAQRGFTADMPFTNVHGNGGLLTTVGDMLKWNAFLDNPSMLPGGASLVSALETQMTLNSGKRIAYALGVSVANTDGIREVTHGGSTAGYRTWLARYPERQVSVAVLCNHAGAAPTSYGNGASNILLARAPRPAVAQTGAAETSPGDVSRYAGVFRNAATQQVVRTVVRDGKLETTIPARLTLVPTGPDKFRVPGQGELTYLFANGKLRGATLESATDTTRFDVMPHAATGKKAYTEYLGSYWSEELETRVTVELQDTVLVVKQRPAEVARMSPMFKDGFAGAGVGNLVFSRDTRGRINGFGIWAGRVRNVRFTKEK